MAMESKETVYFDEEAECARAAVKEVMDMFEGLLGKLQESKKAALQRSMGLKMEQLKAELQQMKGFVNGRRGVEMLLNNGLVLQI
ncbi:hypothetical protein D5086_011244 [Populus alba]|uniref:Uncharacterized protein n=1 Tax=Populus alba TaxID=43335 RepID=A0ACC4CC05_POPAL